MTWWLGLGLVLCLLAAAAAGFSAYGAKRWAHTTRTLSRRLEAGRIDETVRPPSPARFDLRELDGLPAPVQRYFRAALKVMLPWEGRWSDYPMRGGMTVPLTGEAAWLRPQGRKPYFVGTVTSLSYAFAP